MAQGQIGGMQGNPRLLMGLVTLLVNLEKQSSQNNAQGLHSMQGCLTHNQQAAAGQIESPFGNAGAGDVSGSPAASGAGHSRKGLLKMMMMLMMMLMEMMEQQEGAGAQASPAASSLAGQICGGNAPAGGSGSAPAAGSGAGNTPATGNTGTPTTGSGSTPANGDTGTPTTGSGTTPATGDTGTPATGSGSTPATGTGTGTGTSPDTGALSYDALTQEMDHATALEKKIAADPSHATDADLQQMKTENAKVHQDLLAAPVSELRAHSTEINAKMDDFSASSRAAYQAVVATYGLYSKQADTAALGKSEATIGVDATKIAWDLKDTRDGVGAAA